MSESKNMGGPLSPSCKIGNETAVKVSDYEYKSVVPAENTFAPTLVTGACAAGDRERGLPGRRDDYFSVSVGDVSSRLTRALLRKVRLRVDGDETAGEIWIAPRDVPIVRQVLRGIQGSLLPEREKTEAQAILDRLVEQGMCPACGEMHPYGGLCTSCLEQQARADEAADAHAHGYRVDELGDWRQR